MRRPRFAHGLLPIATLAVAVTLGASSTASGSIRWRSGDRAPVVTMSRVDKVDRLTALAAREGLDMNKVIGIISAAGGKSGMMDLYGEMTLKRDFTPLMSLANAQKDVRYYAEWLEQAGLPGFMAQSVNQTYALAALMGHGEESCTAVIKAYEALTGVEATLKSVS